MQGYVYAGLAALIVTGAGAGPVLADSTTTTATATLDLRREVLLRTMISRLGRQADRTDYAVLVRAEGGVARDVGLSVSAR
ncbi:MAG: hypothetical protein ABIQ26_04320, partial [Streptosporangiaceae bacterium]